MMALAWIIPTLTLATIGALLCISSGPIPPDMGDYGGGDTIPRAPHPPTLSEHLTTPEYADA
jgi:hypothetical protein